MSARLKPTPFERAGRPAYRYALEPASELCHVPGFLDAREREELWQDALSYPWEQKPVRGVRTLRSNCWFSNDPSAVYEYSGQRWQPVPLTPRLVALGERLAAELGEPSNAVLASYYPNGAAAVAYHADDEALFGPEPVIATLSVGELRVFQVAERRRAKPGHADLELELASGDLLVMRGRFQEHYRHALKKARPSLGARLNLSYRRVLAPG